MLLDELKKITKPVFFVTNDVSRGIGLEGILPNYHIICLDDQPVVDLLSKAGISVFCLEKNKKEKNFLPRNSGIILEQPEVLSFIKEKSGNQTPNILFFKPQRKLEILAKKYGFRLLGNSSDLNRLFENKINFYRIVSKAGFPLPPSKIVLFSEVNFSEVVNEYGLPFVLQFGLGWAGNSTFFVSSSKQFESIRKIYGKVVVKVEKFIQGITVTNNAVVLKEGILQSSPAIQIKAHPLLTKSCAGTGGRQWPAKISEEQTEKIISLTQKMGLLMRERRYLGYFGLDFLLEDQSGQVLISENNARLTASAPFYTKLELNSGYFPLLGCHLLCFMGQSCKDMDVSIPSIKGGEVIVRNTKDIPVKITGEVKTGIYDHCLQFKKDAFFIEKPESNMWLTTAGVGRKINPEIEIMKIDTYGDVCDGKGTLSENYQKAIEEFLTRLKLSRCQS